MTDLHSQIMNLPCAPSEIPGVNSEFAYRVGHRDARHAAAELALAQDARIRQMEEALLKCARMAEALKRECGMDPESPQAIRNGQYMNISYAARAALKEPS